ncbi:DUF3533 domain-containing protein [Mycena chlorophos]|uniref:DUF3533 domain-containing protein n=1 Tax=Mycena chlorophos TaxID=658473 RepID=A0A8H6TM73_MYCCL|nr:DUF3533 domain-containing protein [Mycena chlorophos]
MASNQKRISVDTLATLAEEQPSLPSAGFLDKTPQAAAARAVYLRTVVGGLVGISIAIFAIFSIYWGSVWSSPRHSLPGWIVDFDGGVVGQTVAQALSSIQPTPAGVAWTVVSASQFPGGISELEQAIVDERVWYAVAINAGASANLSSAVSSADASYEASSAISFIGSEARNENIYAINSIVVSAQLEAITHQFAVEFLKNISSVDNLSQLLSSVPEVISRPIYFSTVNLRPFDVPVASAVTFVGLIYLIILTFFIVNVSAAARQSSGLEINLCLRSLVTLRLGTAFVAYFFVSLFYTLLSRAFQLPFSRHFGSAGFPVFWMLNFIGMLACGLALEAMLTLLTIRFVPFFLILWIISNVAAAVFPIAALPHVYHYGYAFPVYNISRAVRAIVFGTKNELGLNFGVLFVWIAISCVTIPLFQWFARRRSVAGAAKPTSV